MMLSQVSIESLDSLRIRCEEFFGILYNEPDFDLMKPTRLRRYVDARRVFVLIAMEMWSEFTNQGLNQLLANYLEKNHATILHLHKTGKLFLEIDKSFEKVYLTLRGETKGIADSKYLPYLYKEMEMAMNRINHLSTLIEKMDDGYAGNPLSRTSPKGDVCIQGEAQPV
jgi:hypothetical protein